MAVDTWTGAAGGSFDDPSNWSSGSVPGGPDRAIISVDGTVTTNGGEAVDTLALGAAATLLVHNFVVLGSPGPDSATGLSTNAGTIVVADNGAFDAGGTLANTGVVLLGAGADGTALVVGNNTVSSLVLSGGGTLLMTDSRANFVEGGTSGAVFRNVDNVMEGAGSLGDGNLSVVNTGTIDATGAAAQLLLRGAGLTNSALLEATGSAGLAITETVTNTGGRIVAASGNVDLEGGADIVGGTLVGTDGGLVVFSGTPLLDGATAGAITLVGTAALADNNNVAAAGTLVNEGTFVLGSTGDTSSLFVGSGTDTALVLSGGGTLLMTDFGTNFISYNVGGAVLDNVDNVIEGSGVIGDGNLSVVNGGTIDATGSAAGLLLRGPSLLNTGLVEATGSAGLVLQSTVTNDGTLRAGPSSVLSAQSGEILTNDVAGTLTGDPGGTYEADTNGVLALSGTVVTVDAATIILSGTGSAITFSDAGAGPVGIDTSLARVAASGELALLDGRVFASGNLVNAGTILLGAATLATALGNSGTVVGTGTVAGPVANTGTIETGAGTLTVAGAIIGAGTLVAAAPGVLDLDGSVGNGQTAVFGGAGATLRLETPTTFSGSLAGVDPGITIDLPGTVVAAATLGAQALALEGTFGALSIAVAGEGPGERAVIRPDGRGGSEIVVVREAEAGIIAPGTIDFGIRHVGDTVVPVGLTISNLAPSGAYSEVLDASIASATAGIIAAGTVAVAPGASRAGGLTVGISTASAGIRNGSASVAFATDGSTVPADGAGPLPLGTRTVTVTGTVDNYATAAFVELSGPGTLATAGTVSTLSLGTITAGSTIAIDLGVLNAALGPAADTLSGSLSFSGTDPLTATGPLSFAGDVFGGIVDTGTFSFIASGGTITEAVTLVSSSDDSASRTALGTRILDIVGTVVPCFRAGTRIATPEGERPVETLAIGDCVLTASGAARPIRWIGRRSYDARIAARCEALAPVRIRAGALADGIPRRDLDVSPLHAMFLDGVLVPAERLVNGVSITRPVPEGEVRYIHLELETHDVVLAEGAPAETFLDCGNRDMFHNADEYAALHPGRAGGLSPLAAPFVEGGETLERIRRAIAARAGAAAAPAAGLPLRGHADEADLLRVTGWAWAGEGAAPVELEIADAHGVLGTAIANRPRPDVAAAGFGDGFAGFEFRFEPPLSPLRRHVLTVTRRSDGAPLERATLVVEPAAVLQPEDCDLIERSLATLEAAGGETIDRTLAMLARTADRLRTAGACHRLGLEAPRGHARWSSRWAAGAGEDASARPAAIFIDDRVPTPGRDAGSRAALSVMRSLVRLGFSVLLVPVDLACDQASAQALAAEGIAVARRPEDASVEEVLRRLGPLVSLAIVHRISNAEIYLPLLRRLCPAARTAFMPADLHWLRVARQAACHDDPALLAESARLRRAEAIAAEAANVTLVHSDVEADLLARDAPRAELRVLPWHVPAIPLTGAAHAPPAIGFVGGFRHAPNVDAVAWLALAVAPCLHAVRPDATFRIFGADAPPRLVALASERFVFEGHVADPRDVYRDLRAVAAPLRFGAGVKGKVLEAMAAGRPVVCTPVAAEGIALPAPLAALVAADAAAFAGHLADLLADPARVRACAGAGLRAIEAGWTEAAVDRALAGALGLREGGAHLRDVSAA